MSPNETEEPARSALQIDRPARGALVYDEAISIAGRIRLPTETSAAWSVYACIDGECVGETRLFAFADDAQETRFHLLGRLRNPLSEIRDATLRVSVSSREDGAVDASAETPVRLVAAALRERHYGDVVHPHNERLLGRENIYGSGPPVEFPSPDALRLALEYLPTRSSVVDVGCGAGAYAPALLDAGHTWLGLEVSADCWKILDRRGFNYRRVDRDTPQFPCVDSEFDSALCIEVLEHIADPETFAAEIARITRNRALFSVPNLEVLPYFQGWGVVPWHLLEGDHKNFFTRGSLRRLLARHFRNVEVFSYAEHPLTTRDGLPLHVHLLAVAEK